LKSSVISEVVRACARRVCAAPFWAIISPPHGRKIGRRALGEQVRNTIAIVYKTLIYRAPSVLRTTACSIAVNARNSPVVGQFGVTVNWSTA
jgi:hypothetical protein